MSKFVKGETVQDVFTNSPEKRAEARRKEWEEAKERAAKQPVKDTEDNYDPRSLYERLKEQKDKKLEDLEEKQKFKNQIAYLDDEDVQFLEQAAEEDAKKEETRWVEEMADVEAYRLAVAKKEEDRAKNFNLTNAEPTLPAPKSNNLPTTKKNTNMLLGIVKRPLKPSSPSGTRVKRTKTDKNENESCPSISDKHDSIAQKPLAALVSYGSDLEDSDD
eukprot:CFRG3027T1